MTNGDISALAIKILNRHGIPLVRALEKGGDYNGLNLLALLQIFGEAMMGHETEDKKNQTICGHILNRSREGRQNIQCQNLPDHEGSHFWISADGKESQSWWDRQQLKSLRKQAVSALNNDNEGEK